MPAAIFIARLVGPCFAAIGLGILLNTTFYLAALNEGVRSPVLIYLSGIATLLGGLAILNAHRAWSADWRVIVTIIGWMLTIAGIVRIVLPRVAAAAATRLYFSTATMAIVGAVVLVIGGYLSFEGYRRRA
jgi:hypothetical protein